MELKRKLVEYMLSEERRASERRVEAEAIGAALNDRSQPLDQSMRDIGEFYLTSNLEDRMFLAQMALWPYAKGVHSANEGRQHITDSLLKLYRAWDVEIESAINTFLINHSDVCTPSQDWITSREFAILASALAEGLTIRASLDSDDVALDLPGRALLALLATLFTCEGEQGEHPDGSLPAISELDRRRLSTQVTEPAEPSSEHSYPAEKRRHS